MRRVLPPLPALALTLPLLLAVALLTAGGCGTDGPGAAAADEDKVVVEVMIEGDHAQPAGDRLQVEAGEPVELVVMADSAGKIHVHTEPEKEIEYQPGTTTVSLQLDRPGLVDVELHDPDQLLVQLEVR